MTMTYEQAISALNEPQYQTLTGLQSLVSQVSVDVYGSANSPTTLLYSGMMSDLEAWRIAEKIGETSNGHIVTIGQTPVTKFLGSVDFLMR